MKKKKKGFWGNLVGGEKLEGFWQDLDIFSPNPAKCSISNLEKKHMWQNLVEFVTICPNFLTLENIISLFHFFFLLFFIPFFSSFCACSFLVVLFYLFFSFLFNSFLLCLLFLRVTFFFLFFFLCLFSIHHISVLFFLPFFYNKM